MANRLIEEQSPYLLQHAHNPVDWYPWGDEAFALAKETNRPLIVSIGYAACHWCHVMERESFEDDDTAAYMNEHFVCVKVDREEHPDVDHMYMDAVQAISGSGGWPLNVFVTPDRMPFYGGTYFPPRQGYGRPSWGQILQRMNEVWTQQPEEITAQTEQMTNYLKQASQKGFAAVEAVWDKDTCSKIADNLLKQADKEKGGFGGAPKFPGTMAISYLIEHHHFAGNKDALKHALKSLDAMMEGGIYDQLGGGFARYSTDRNWLAPHFEKMLYDNALLIVSLCDAYSVTNEEKYKKIIEETIGFAERELKDESGGYYSALDADSEGVEGKFYTWTWEEWVNAGMADNHIATDHFGVVKTGNWEETNILHIATNIDDVAAKHNVSIDEAQHVINETKKKLFALRVARIRPLTDDKSLLSWNALMNIALSKAGVVLQEQQYIQRAETHMQWMLETFFKNGALLHTWKKGHARIAAKLDDYAYLIQALLQLASAGGNNEWVLKADELIAIVLRDFIHEDSVFFYYTSQQQKDIPVRKVDTYDGATPSANAVMAHNLWLCGMCVERSELVEQAVQMMGAMSNTVMRYAYSFGYWSILLQRHVAGMRTVVCAGRDAEASSRTFMQHFNPQCYTVTSEKEISVMPILENKFFGDNLYIFVCTEQACLAPVHSVKDALSLVK